MLTSSASEDAVGASGAAPEYAEAAPAENFSMDQVLGATARKPAAAEEAAPEPEATPVKTH